MHPALTAFISDLAYEGRLEAAPGRERVAVLGEGPLSGSGLRVHPVRHLLTAADKSPQEADIVARLWHSVQGSSWRNHEGVESRVGPEQVLVVAPYNAQVALIKAALPAGARAERYCDRSNDAGCHRSGLRGLGGSTLNTSSRDQRATSSMTVTP